MQRMVRKFWGAAIAVVGLTGPLCAQAQPDLDLSADIRMRLEQDWDSRKADGTMRQDRARSRIRLRVMAQSDLGGGVAIAGRVRSAIPGSQQNANVTFADFNGNGDDVLVLLADRYSLSWQGQGQWQGTGVEIGRMAFPFRTRHEYFWDGDISPLGAAGHVRVLDGGARLSLHGGVFHLPAGADNFSGSLIGAQAQLDLGAAQFDAGLFGFEANRDDPDRTVLLDGNGQRDYAILAVNAQHSWPLAGSTLSLAADLYHNLADYSGSADPFVRANHNRKTGYVLSALWGSAASAGDVQLGYRFSHIERFATNASYAHDDLARFGSASQARLSDNQGHDLFANWRITSALSAGMRAMVVERISNGENGKRVRLDLAYRF